MFEIKPATRVGVNPLIVTYSESGCGKTFSALLLARGLAGAKGKIVVADSESRRASLYADIPEIGGFETFDLCAPFSPARYIEAIETIEASGAAVGIIDSGSHEWENTGGVLDMAAANEERSGKAGLHNWKTPKHEHAKFLLKLLSAKIPMIVCLRAKYKSRQTKDANNKTVILKDEMTSPIQAEDFIFEATCHFEILQNHSIILTKCSHPALRDCFPKDKTDPIAIKHGELLAAWCNNASKPVSGVGNDELKTVKAELWALLKPVRGAAKDWSGANNWLFAEDILDPAKEPPEQMPDLSVEKIREVIIKAKAKL